MFVTGGSELIASQSNALLLIKKTPLVNSCLNSFFSCHPFTITSFGYVRNTTKCSIQHMLDLPSSVWRSNWISCNLFEHEIFLDFLNVNATVYGWKMCAVLRTISFLHSEHSHSISFTGMSWAVYLTLKRISGKRDSHTLNYCWHAFKWTECLLLYPDLDH